MASRPGQVANVIGSPGDDHKQTDMRLIGLREIVSGVEILAQAKYARERFADVGPLKPPECLTDEQAPLRPVA